MGSRHSRQRVVRLAGDRGEKRLVRLHKAGDSACACMC